MPNAMRIVLAAALLTGCGYHAFGASANSAPAVLTVQRSTRVFPHKFTVHPDGATVAANQTQRFEVTDAQGNAVAVHWNVSGLSCSGMACGTIDSDGVYRTPSALPHPQEIILEAVLDSNPNYSVLTQVELVPAVAASVSPSGSPGRSPNGSASGTPRGSGAQAQVSVAKTQPMPRLAEQQNLALARNTVVPPLPNAIAATPVIERQTVTRASQSPQPNVTRPIAVIEAGNVAPEHSLPPLPAAIAAAPIVERQVAGRASMPPPTPNVTAPLPVIEGERRGPAHSYSLPPLPAAVAAAPVADKQMIARTPPPPQPNVMAPPPVIEARSVSPSQSSPLLPKQAAVAPAAKSQPNANSPTITSQTIQTTKSQTIKIQSSESQSSKSQTKSQSGKSQTIALDSLAPPASVMVTVPVSGAKAAPSGHSSPPEPKAVAAAPAVQTQLIARASVPPPLSNVAAPPPIAPSVIEEKTAATSHLLPPPNTPAAAPLLEQEKLAKEMLEKEKTDKNKTEKATQTVALATAVLPSLPPAQFSTAKTLSPAAPAAGTNVAIRGTLLPVPDEATAASAAKSATAPNGLTVTYRDGQLTIDAQNSTLAEVLRMVAEKSGAKIEVPPGSGLERIFEHAGPGPAQDVLVRLLNGSPYDFIIVSSPQTPNTPAQVLLTLRGAEPAPSAPSPAQPVFSAAAQPRPSADPYLWTPPNSTQLYSGDSSPVIPHPPAVAPPTEPLSPDVLEQKLKDFNRQLRGGPPPSQ